jgi:hypothetical protein
MRQPWSMDINKYEKLEGNKRNSKESLIDLMYKIKLISQLAYEAAKHLHHY